MHPLLEEALDRWGEVLEADAYADVDREREQRRALDVLEFWKENGDAPLTTPTLLNSHPESADREATSCREMIVPLPGRGKNQTPTTPLATKTSQAGGSPPHFNAALFVEMCSRKMTKSAGIQQTSKMIGSLTATRCRKASEPQVQQWGRISELWLLLLPSGRTLRTHDRHSSVSADFRDGSSSSAGLQGRGRMHFDPSVFRGREKPEWQIASKLRWRAQRKSQRRQKARNAIQKRRSANLLWRSTF